MQEMCIRSLGWEDPLEEGMATCFSILAWRIPGTEEPGGLQSIGLQKVRQDWSDWTHTHTQRGNYCVTCLLVSKQTINMWCAPRGFEECYLLCPMVPESLSYLKRPNNPTSYGTTESLAGMGHGGPMVSRIVALKGVYILIPWTWEYVT